MTALFELPAALPSHPAKYASNMGQSMVYYRSSQHNKVPERRANVLRLVTRKVRFLMQSYSTPTPYFPANLEDYAPWVAEYGLVAPYGKCQCGCGQAAPISRQSSSSRKAKRNHPLRFFSQQCVAVWNKRNGITAGQFKKGQTSWNKGKKGHSTPSRTRFQKGLIPKNKLPVGAVTIRTNRRDGYARAYVKTAEPNTWRPRYIVVWETHHGAIPKGSVVHHKDRNPLNDSIENLQLMTRAEHMQEHKGEFEQERLQALKTKKSKRGR